MTSNLGKKLRKRNFPKNFRHYFELRNLYPGGMKLENLEALQHAIVDAEKRGDLDKLQKLEKCFELTTEQGPMPFVPRVEFKREAFESVPGSQEGDVAIAAFNSLSRANRGVRYRRKKNSSDYHGPIIVSEGDSWFQYPIKLDDLIDHLMNRYAIKSLGGAGHLLTDMVVGDEYTTAIRNENADFFLISGGGNDMLHSGRLKNFLHPFQSGMTASEAIDSPVFGSFVRSIAGLYQGLFQSLTQQFPSLTILCHGYDYVLPRNGGAWLGGPLESRGVPPNLWNAVLAILIDRLNSMLRSMESAFPGRVFHIDCRHAVGAQKASWHDELHPKNAGYGRAASRFEERIESVFHASDFFELAEAASPEGEAVFHERSVLPSESYSTLSQGGPSAHYTNFGNAAYQTLSKIGSGGNGGIRPSTPQPASSPISRFQGSVSIPDNAARIMTPSTEAVIGGGAMSNRAIFEQVSRAATPARQMKTAPGGVKPAYEGPIWWNERPSPPTGGPNDPFRDNLDPWHLQLDDVDWEAYIHWRSFVTTEALEPESAARIKKRRELASLERIIGDSNICEINFLGLGQRAAKAVGRISVVSKFNSPMGSGTGFLVGPNLILTNHHVLEHEGRLQNSTILFDYEYDNSHSLKRPEIFEFTNEVFFTSRELDFTFASVRPMSKDGRSLSDYGNLNLIRESGKAVKAESVSIIQHANGLPKQIAIHDSRVLGRKDSYIYYTTDTNPGSSGAPVVNDEWLPVALHHRSVPDYAQPRSFVANRGIRISSIFEWLQLQSDRSNQAARTVLGRIEPGFGTSSRFRPSTRVTLAPGGIQPANEALQEVFHEVPYTNRKGYNEDFLGISVPLPQVKEGTPVSQLLDGSEHVIPYEHFSVVMHRERRLALFTASNVDGRPEKQRPEEGPEFDYSRNGLTGVSGAEGWFKDPRLPQHEQLPDLFFTEDNTAFDKGHIVRRNDVTWGDSYQQVRRANGDTFHTTNCSPQVAGFNRSNFRSGFWGKLENEILEQSGSELETYCVFAGPVLDPGDRSFRGVDESGTILVQIPRKYWKVIVVRNGTGLKSFAFVLEQNLSNVPLELEFDAEWEERMVSISELEMIVRHFTFPEAVKESDQGAN